MNRDQRRAANAGGKPGSASPLDPYVQRALQLHQAGRRQEAESLYRQV
ncbi:MAG: tetratricopeptide repeat protein, partial [Mesorhizobium sp.]